MSETFKQKVDVIKSLFADCTDPQSRYARIIELGQKQPALEPSDCIDENRVQGCQSRMYVKAECSEGVMHFSARSDALISSGLAALMVMAYDGESPETVIKESPLFLKELGILESLSPNRANGLASLHMKMRQLAVGCLSAR